MAQLKIPNNVQKVYLRHLRYFPGYYEGVFRRKDVPHLKPLPTGGQTVAELHLNDGRIITGIANCSKSDNFSRKIGRNIAIGRALAQLESENNNQNHLYKNNTHYFSDYTLTNCPYCAGQHA